MSIKKINRKEAINIMEENLRIIKECSDSDTFLVVSSDLERGEFIGSSRLNRNGGIKLIEKSNTYVLNEDIDEDPISILSMYTVLQNDIFNIIPRGEKHDMIIVPQLE